MESCYQLLGRMIASPQLLHPLPGSYGEKRFREIGLAESRDFVLIDVMQRRLFFPIDFLYGRRFPFV